MKLNKVKHGLKIVMKTSNRSKIYYIHQFELPNLELLKLPNLINGQPSIIQNRGKKKVTKRNYWGINASG